MATEEQANHIETLKLAKEAAKAEVSKNSTPETREAYKIAYNALSAYTFQVAPMKGHNVGSRAGKRQTQERRANESCNRRK